MATKLQYRPVLGPEVHKDVKDAFRKITDLMYEHRDSLGPASLIADVVGVPDPVKVPADPNPPGGFGITLRLTRPGSWIVQGSAALTVAGDGGQVFSLILMMGSTAQARQGKLQPTGDSMAMLQQSWQVAASGGETLRLMIQKDGGSGTSSVDPLHSTMTATWQG